MIVNHGCALPLLDEHKQVLKQNMCYPLSSVCVCVYTHDPEYESQESQTGFITFQTGSLWFRENHPNSINSCRSNAMSPLSFFHPFAALISPPPWLPPIFWRLPPSPPTMCPPHHTQHTQEKRSATRAHTGTQDTLFLLLLLSTVSALLSSLPTALSHCLPSAQRKINQWKRTQRTEKQQLGLGGLQSLCLFPLLLLIWSTCPVPRTCLVHPLPFLKSSQVTVTLETHQNWKQGEGAIVSLLFVS